MTTSVRAGGLGAGGAAGGDRGEFTSSRGDGGIDGIRQRRQSAAISSSELCCGGGAWRRFFALLLCLLVLRDIHVLASYGRFHEPTTHVAGDVSQH